VAQGVEAVLWDGSLNKSNLNLFKSVGEETVLKLKLSLVAILSTTAIASGMVLSSVSSVQSCSRVTSEVYQPEGYEPAAWFRSPWIAIITLPGIALAAVLSAGHRWYQKN
jgi:hypothetical protein